MNNKNNNIIIPHKTKMNKEALKKRRKRKALENIINLSYNTAGIDIAWHCLCVSLYLDNTVGLFHYQTTET